MLSALNENDLRDPAPKHPDDVDFVVDSKGYPNSEATKFFSAGLRQSLEPSFADFDEKVLQDPTPRLEFCSGFLRKRVQ